MSLRFAVVHEASADVQIATELADRVIIDTVEWLDDHLIPFQRQWQTETLDGSHLTWRAIPELARKAGIRAHGHFDGEPGFPDAAAARRAIIFLRKTIPDISAILLIRDQDDQPSRRKGLEQARADDRSGIAVIVGLAIVERECWVLSGFDPCDDAESSRLQAERTALGFDPRIQSHLLTACKDDNAVRSAKRVHRQLLENDKSRERLCWYETCLPTLRERGRDNGLEAYLDEIRDRLVPLIGNSEHRKS